MCNLQDCIMSMALKIQWKYPGGYKKCSAGKKEIS